MTSDKSTSSDGPMPTKPKPVIDTTTSPPGPALPWMPAPRMTPSEIDKLSMAWMPGSMTSLSTPISHQIHHRQSESSASLQTAIRDSARIIVENESRDRNDVISRDRHDVGLRNQHDAESRDQFVSRDRYESTDYGNVGPRFDVGLRDRHDTVQIDRPDVEPREQGRELVSRDRHSPPRRDFGSRDRHASSPYDIRSRGHHSSSPRDFNSRDRHSHSPRDFSSRDRHSQSPRDFRARDYRAPSPSSSSSDSWISVCTSPPRLNNALRTTERTVTDFSIRHRITDMCDDNSPSDMSLRRMQTLSPSGDSLVSVT